MKSNRKSKDERKNDLPERTKNNTPPKQAIENRIKPGAENEEREPLFKLMFLHHKSIMLLIDPETGKIVDANDAAAEFYQYSIGELRSMNINNINTLSADEVAIDRKKVMNDEQNQFIFPHKIANGEIRQVHVTSTLIDMNYRKILFSIIEDITGKLELEQRLIRKKEALSKAEQVAKFGSWQLDLKEKIMISSDGAGSIYGLKQNENALEAIKRMALPQYRPMLDKALVELISSGKNYDVEFKIKRESDGKIIDIHSMAEIDHEKNIIYGTIQDITERKKVEEALEDSEEKFRLIIENTSSAILFTEPGGPLNFANPAACKIFGLTNEEFTKLGRNGIVNLNDPRLAASLEERKNTHRFKGELTFVKKDGSIFPGEITSNIFTDSKGIQRTSILINDITERLRIEESLHESELKYRNLVDNSSIGIFQTKINGEILFVNKSMARILDYDTVEDLKKANALVQYKDIRQRQSIIHLLRKNGSIPNIEINVITNKGAEKTLILSNTMTNGIIDGTAIDITDRKQAELKIQQQYLELQKLNTDKDRFMSILAHDLRGPFNSLLGFSEILTSSIRRFDIEKIEEQVSYINTSAQNIYALLDDLLLWTMSQSGKLSFNPLKLNLKDLCADALNALISTANLKDITIELKIMDGALVLADAEMLKTILRNLVSNAIKFTNPNGSIVIFAEPTGSDYTVTVSDNGIGIPPESISKIFDITGTHTTKGTAGEKGTGLGLIICKDFVEKHGGEIRVESVQGQGSRFIFTLPFA